MDSFIFRSSTDARAYLKIGDIAGESQLDPAMIWGSDGASLKGMHVDPVIPGADRFEDPLLGYDLSVGFEDPLLG